MQQTIEAIFWQKMNTQKHTQKGMEYDHLRVSGKTGFYNENGELLGYVERVLAHSSYYFNEDIFK